MDTQRQVIESKLYAMTRSELIKFSLAMGVPLQASVKPNRSELIERILEYIVKGKIRLEFIEG